jgi:hypothetical protein
LYAIGEHTALLTWLEFPDYNIQLKSGLFASCVPVESTWNLYSEPSQMDQTGCLLVVAVLMNVIILLMEITMHYTRCFCVER